MTTQGTQANGARNPSCHQMMMQLHKAALMRWSMSRATAQRQDCVVGLQERLTGIATALSYRTIVRRYRAMRTALIAKSGLGIARTTLLVTWEMIRKIRPAPCEPAWPISPDLTCGARVEDATLPVRRTLARARVCSLVVRPCSAARSSQPRRTPRPGNCCHSLRCLRLSFSLIAFGHAIHATRMEGPVQRFRSSNHISAASPDFILRNGFAVVAWSIAPRCLSKDEDGDTFSRPRSG